TARHGTSPPHPPPRARAASPAAAPRATGCAPSPASPPSAAARRSRCPAGPRRPPPPAAPGAPSPPWLLLASGVPAEADAPVHHPNADPASGRHLPGEDVLRKRRLDRALEDLPHRPRAEQRVHVLRVEQHLHHVVPGGEGDAPLLGQPPAALLQQHARDPAQLLPAERGEHQPLVDAVPQLGWQRTPGLAERR